MREMYYKKSNIVGGKVDDVVKTLKELKEKMKLLEGCVYSHNMLVYVEEKKAIYVMKERGY